MTDLTSPALIKLKALLFLILALFSGGWLIVETPQLKTICLLSLCVWSFCRCYYFAFYVIEKYIDPTSRYSGLWAFVTQSLLQRRKT